MKIVIYGATGMVGQGVLRECLLAPDVEQVLSIGRNSTGQSHPRLRELVQKDLTNLSDIETQLSGYDACFFCLGVSSAGMNEADYRKITYDLAMAAANTLVKLNPGMTFVYVSGVGTDSTEKGSAMWARIKGAAENAIQKLPFKASYMFRPGLIIPMHGITSRTRVYRIAYILLAPIIPIWRMLSPSSVVTTEQVGQAMLGVARHGAPKTILEPPDIAAAAKAA